MDNDSYENNLRIFERKILRKIFEQVEMKTTSTVLDVIMKYSI